MTDNRMPFRWRVLGAAVIVVLAIAALVIVSRKLGAARTPIANIATEPVSRRTIAQTVEATGTVEPVEVVEIKSKASGQILKMPVELGSVVRAGDLLAQIDTVTVRNQYNQAMAQLEAAKAQVMVTTAAKARADTLYAEEASTADEHEAALLAYAQAHSMLATATSNLEIARQAYEDATLRAPSNGTVIEQDVVRGQVIASATASASGGTTLLKMADLSRVQMQAMVSETDVGNVRSGMEANVTVDAFPRRMFKGTVLKIEPQAAVVQSVTEFPVLISIQNENGLLLPGMNGEVTIAIDQREDALVVPLDAVRTIKELPTIATALGLNPDTLRSELRASMQTMHGGPGGGGMASGFGGQNGGGQRGGGQGGGGQGGMGWRAGHQGGAGGTFTAAARPAGTGDPSSRSPAGAGAGNGAGGNAGNRSFVMVQSGSQLVPRAIRTGISDFDYVEVLGGVKEGEPVALLSTAVQAAKRDQDKARMQQRMGNGLTGPSTGGAGGAGGSRGGTGGGGRNGG